MSAVVDRRAVSYGGGLGLAGACPGWPVSALRLPDGGAYAACGLRTGSVAVFRNSMKMGEDRRIGCIAIRFR